MTQPGKVLFSPGNIVATPGALAAVSASGDDLFAYLIKHVTLDPGDLTTEDVAENWFSLESGLRILSAYTLTNGTRIWLITEADRSSTCVLLPEEY